MRHACDAELPEGLLDEAEIHKISSVPDLTYLDAPAEEQGGGLKAAPARVMWAPPCPGMGDPTARCVDRSRCSDTARRSSTRFKTIR